MISTMTKEELFQVPLPTKTKTYSPVPHRDIIETVEGILNEGGIGIAKETFRTNSKGTQLIGQYDLDRMTGDKDFGYRISFRNSYDKSMSVGFYAGAVVLVCSNGMMVSLTNHEMFKRKHTGSIREQISTHFMGAFKQLKPVMQKTLQDAEQMKGILVDKKLAAELCGRMFIEQELINSTQLNIIKREIHNPSYAAFNDESLWSFYNHVTHSFKHEHPTKYMDKHKKLHSFVEAEFDL